MDYEVSAAALAMGATQQCHPTPCTMVKLAMDGEHYTVHAMNLETLRGWWTTFLTLEEARNHYAKTRDALASSDWSRA